MVDHHLKYVFVVGQILLVKYKNHSIFLEHPIRQGPRPSLTHHRTPIYEGEHVENLLFWKGSSYFERTLIYD